jgi:hypothetical protein
MNNKVILSVILLITGIILMNLNFSTAQTSNTCSPAISIINQDPNPAVPDDYVKVVFEVSNLQDCQEGLAVKLDPQYPFSLDPGVDPVQTIAASPNVQTYKSTWDVPFKIRIASDALDGDYQLKLDYHPGTSKNFDSLSIENDYNVSIIDSQTDFDVIIQDASGTQASLGIVNIGKNTANSLVVKIPQQSSFRPTGASEQIVGNLAAGDYTIVSFNIAQTFARNFNGTGFNGNRTMGGQPNQDGQILKVQIDYTDGIGKRRSITKDVQFNSFSQYSGNFTRGALGSRSTTTTSSGLSTTWKYIIGAAIIIILVLLLYYRDNIMEHYKRNKGERSSRNTPDWVSSERAHRKK